MISEAEAHAEEDQKKRGEVELRNNAENATYAAEKMISDNADKVTPEIKEEIEKKVSEVRTALQSESTASIQSTVDELQAAMQKLGSEVYNQPKEGNTDSEDGSEDEDTKPEGTVEGEYREV